MSLQSTFLTELQEISRSSKKEEGRLIQTEIDRVKVLIKQKANEGSIHTIDCRYSKQVVEHLKAEGLSA